MEELLFILIQVFLEFIIQAFGSPGLSYAGNSKTDRGCLIVVLHMLMGAALGGLSSLISPNLVLPNLPLQIANILAMPFIAAAIGYSFAKAMNRRGFQWEPEIHALQGGLFALMFNILRFVCVKGM